MEEKVHRLLYKECPHSCPKASGGYFCLGITGWFFLDQAQVEFSFCSGGSRGQGELVCTVFLSVIKATVCTSRSFQLTEFNKRK